MPLLDSFRVDHTKMTAPAVRVAAFVAVFKVFPSDLKALEAVSFADITI